MKLAGTSVLITGATGGIGRATSRQIAALGAELVVTGRSGDALQQVARETGAGALPADLTDPRQLEGLVREVLERSGGIDVLVNNAGVGWAGRLADMPATDIDELVALNLTAPIRLTRALVPSMLARGQGQIVNVASISGHVGVRNEAVYAATKAGLLGFSESLRYELAGSGVRVSTVSPGVVATKFFERRGDPYTRSRPRPMPPERIARAIVRAIEQERDEIVEPGWLRFPIWLRGTWPALYRALARRWG